MQVRTGALCEMLGGAMNCLPPSSIAEATVTSGERKSRLEGFRLAILGVLGGVYIAFGAQLFTLVTSDLSKVAGYGLSRLLGGVAFSVGLVLVVLCGAELFTGNSLVALAAFSHRIPWRGVLRNWGYVYLANLAGSLIFALMLFGTRQYMFSDNTVGANALRIAVAKVNMPFGTAFLRGILCNWLVCLAVWMATAADDVTGKILGAMIPVTVFVASGFEHSVANMFFIPMGLLLRRVPAVVQAAGPVAGLDKLTWWSGLWVRNLLPVTLGNLTGGVFFVAFLYWVSYLRLREQSASGGPR